MSNIWTRPTPPGVGPGLLYRAVYALDTNNPWGRWNRWAVEGGIWYLQTIGEAPFTDAGIGCLSGDLTYSTANTYDESLVATSLATLNAGYNANRTDTTLSAVRDDPSTVIVTATYDGIPPLEQSVKAACAVWGIVQDILLDDLAEAYTPTLISPGSADSMPRMVVVLDTEAAADHWETLVNEWATLWMEV